MSPLCSLNANWLCAHPSGPAAAAPDATEAGACCTSCSRFTFYCLCAHMVSSLYSRLYCHYHHHVAINAALLYSDVEFMYVIHLSRHTRRIACRRIASRFVSFLFIFLWGGWVWNCFGTWNRAPICHLSALLVLLMVLVLPTTFHNIPKCNYICMYGVCMYVCMYIWGH